MTSIRFFQSSAEDVMDRMNEVFKKSSDNHVVVVSFLDSLLDDKDDFFSPECFWKPHFWSYVRVIVDWWLGTRKEFIILQGLYATNFDLRWRRAYQQFVGAKRTNFVEDVEDIGGIRLF